MNRSRVGLVAIFALAAVGVPFLYAGVGKLASFDPFAQFAGKWSDPFGNNTGSVMEKVDVSLYEGSNKTVSFHANRLTIRRDKQHMQLELISNGKIFDKGKPTAGFEAGLATYDVPNEHVDVAGGAVLTSKDYSFKTASLQIDRKKKTIQASRGISGKYRGGILNAETLAMDFGAKRAKATKVSWKGKVALQAKSQDTREIQIRSATFEQLSNNVSVYYDAEASDKDSIMRAKKITWDQDKDIITMEGSCEYYGPDAVISAPKVIVYHKEKRALATGDVRMLVKPEKQKGVLAAEPIPPAKPVLPPGMKQPPGVENSQQQEIDEELRSGKTLRKYPVVITCSKLEYSYKKGSKKAVITGSPHARQILKAGSWREVTAPKVVYEEEKELLTLFSEKDGRDVKMNNSAGDSFTAETLQISTVEGKEHMLGTHLEGVMKVKEEETGSPPPRSR